MGSQSVSVTREAPGAATWTAKQASRTLGAPMGRGFTTSGDIPVSAYRANLRAAPRGAGLRLPLQKQLAIGASNDPLERDADAVAARVMSMPGSTQPAPDSRAPALRRECACESSGIECEACKRAREVTVQPKSTGAVMRAEAPPIVHDALRSPGQPLDAQTRAFFEPKFHHDFGRVRVHTDEQSAEATRAVSASAYTVGSHIFFGQRVFSPMMTSGKRLLAHELTHVVQQETSQPAVMRSPLLSSTMKVCKRVLKGEHVFHVSEGGVIVTANARWEPSDEWEGAERPECGNGIYNISLTDKGTFFDNDYGTCAFPTGFPFSRQWTNIPENDYYVTIWTNNTNPNCCLQGEIEISQQKGLSGPSCTQPPPGPLEILHGALNIAGLIPALGAVPDAINAGIYLVEGDWTNAGISAIAMIPIFGEAASVVNIGEKTAVRVTGRAVEQVGKDEIAAGLKEARAAEAARTAKEAQAAREGIAGAEEIKLSQAEYEAALKMVFPGQSVNEVAKLVDGIGQRAAERAMANPRFVAAMESGNWTLAGTLFHSAAAQEARAIPRSLLPEGWTLEAERTIQSGAGGSRADILLQGPGGQVVEFDWKTTGKSAIASKSVKQMERHAGQITVNVGGHLSTQESRSWMDYIRPLL